MERVGPRRKQAHGIIARADDQQPLLGGSLRDLRRRYVAAKFQPHQQPHAADIFDDVGMLILETRKSLLQVQRLGPDIFKKTRFRDDVEHRRGDGHRQRIAAERRTVRAGRHALRGLGRRQHRGGRKAAAETFGDRHDIRHDTGPLVREEFPVRPTPV